MELQEFSDQFDVLYNNITSNQAPGLDEYEKSVFLTKAQNEILLSYFDPKSNKVQEGFDGSQRRQIDFSMVTMAQHFNEDNSVFNNASFDNRQNSRNIFMPENVLMLLNEKVLVDRNIGDGKTKETSLTVVPITYAEYDRLMSKPYKRPLKWQAWRIIINDGGMSADLIVGPNDTIKGYSVRYLVRPMPIIVSKLEDGLKIEEEEGPCGCVLDPILHPEIIQRAVELAKAAYAGDLTTTIALGQSSETPMGYVSSK